MKRIDTEDKRYQRDMRSKALVLSDTGVRDEYLARKKMMDRNRSQEKELNTLRDEVTELREMVKKLINGSS